MVFQKNLIGWVWNMKLGWRLWLSSFVGCQTWNLLGLVLLFFWKHETYIEWGGTSSHCQELHGWHHLLNSMKLIIGREVKQARIVLGHRETQAMEGLNYAKHWTHHFLPHWKSTPKFSMLWQQMFSSIVLGHHETQAMEGLNNAKHWTLNTPFATPLKSTPNSSML